MPRPELLQAQYPPVYFQAMRFRKTAEEYDNNYMALLSQGEKASARLKLYCIDPSRKLAGGRQEAAV